MSSAAEGLKKVVYQRVQPTDEEWQSFIAQWQPFTFPKNHIVTDFGQIEPYFYYVHTGVIRGYFEKDAEEYSMGFSYHGEFSGVFDSFVLQKPAQYCLETISESSGLKISHTALNQLFDEYKVFERWGRLFSEMILCGFGAYFQSILADSAEERFNRLFNNAPQVFQLIPQKHLASYLGMTPETFSRMRKKAMG